MKGGGGGTGKPGLGSLLEQVSTRHTKGSHILRTDLCKGIEPGRQIEVGRDPREMWKLKVHVGTLIMGRREGMVSGPTVGGPFAE